MLNEISQSHKILHISLFYSYEMSRIKKSIDTERIFMVSRGCKKWGMEVAVNEYRISHWSNENALKLDVVMIAEHFSIL